MKKDVIVQKLKNKKKAGQMIFAMTASTGENVRVAKEAGVDFVIVHKESLFGIDGRLPALARVGYGGNCNEIMLEEAEHILRFSNKLPVIAGIGVAEPYYNVDRITEKIIGKGYSGVTHIPTSGGWVGTFGSSINQAGCGYSEEIEFIRRCRKKDIFTVGYCFEKGQVKAMTEAGADVLAVYVQKTTGESHGWHNAESEEKAIAKAKVMVSMARSINPHGIVVVSAGDVNNAGQMKKLIRGTKADGYLADETLEDKVIFDAVYKRVHKAKQKLDKGTAGVKRLLACESAIGIHAKAAAAGGADIVMVNFSGYRRTLGYDAEQAFRYSDHMNQIILKQAKHIIPLCENIPVLAGVNVYNDMETAGETLTELRRAGYAGVMNAPEARLYKRTEKIDLECEMLCRAKKRGFFTAGVIMNSDDLNKMKKADPNIYIILFPKKLDMEAEKRVCSLVRAVKKEGKNSLLYLAGEVGEGVLDRIRTKAVEASGIAGTVMLDSISIEEEMKNKLYEYINVMTER